MVSVYVRTPKEKSKKSTLCFGTRVWFLQIRSRTTIQYDRGNDNPECSVSLLLPSLPPPPHSRRPSAPSKHCDCARVRHRVAWGSSDRRPCKPRYANFSCLFVLSVLAGFSEILGLVRSGAAATDATCAALAALYVPSSPLPPLPARALTPASRHHARLVLAGRTQN